jgi:hypothetical protein
MRRGQIGLVVICAAAAGCAHEAYDQAAAATAAGASIDFEHAYVSVRSGARETARAGNWAFDRAGRDTVRVIRVELAGPSRGITDVEIANAIAERLAIDPSVRGRDLSVAASAGVVTLRGWVGSPHEATRVIRTALDENGVIAVDAELNWPTAQARTYGH